MTDMPLVFHVESICCRNHNLRLSWLLREVVGSPPTSRLLWSLLDRSLLLLKVDAGIDFVPRHARVGVLSVEAVELLIEVLLATLLFERYVVGVIRALFISRSVLLLFHR